MSPIWTFFNSPLGVAIIVGISAEFMRRRFQRETEIREQKLEWLKKAKDEQEQLIDRLTSLMGKHFFGLVRVYFALKERNANQSEINECWEQHEKLRKEWDENLFSNRISIQRLATIEAANKFFCLDEQVPQDLNEEIFKKNSFYGLYKCVHNKLKHVWEKMELSSENIIDEDDLNKLKAGIEALKNEIDNFFNDALSKNGLKSGFSQRLKNVENLIVKNDITSI